MRNPDLVKRLRWGSDKKMSGMRPVPYSHPCFVLIHCSNDLGKDDPAGPKPKYFFFTAIMSQPFATLIKFSALIIKWVCQVRKLLPEVGKPTSTCPRRLWSSARSSGTMGRWKVLVTRQDRVRSPTNLGSGSSAGKTATLKTGHRISLLLNILFFTMNQSISVFIWRRRLLAASVADPAP